METLFFRDTKWVFLIEAVYILLLIGVCIRVVYDTRSVAKTLGYLLLVIFVPIAGMIFYFSFGINYRKRKIYTKKLEVDESIKIDFERRMKEYDEVVSSFDHPVLKDNRPLVYLLSNTRSGGGLVAENSEVRVLQNGEEFFPALFDEIRKAERHIHIEFYIYEDDVIGNQLKELMVEKVKQGVEVRFIYDDFGSMRIRRTFVRELRESGVQAFPFNRIRMVGLANRLNYRNHRKIVIIDGFTSFIGGINVSDKYINNGSNALYWRDTHLMIKGYSSLALQQIFLADWNFCAGSAIQINRDYFPLHRLGPGKKKLVQIAASGPDSDLPSILYSVIQAVNKAKEEILITTPYYIPDTSLQESLIIAALSRVKVRLLVPALGDSLFVSIASQSYFEELLNAGVEIFLYRKGFVHAKTFVVDRKIASVGTANMDSRSFDLNFEVSALIYDEEVAGKLANDFFSDLETSDPVDFDRWMKRPRRRVFVERLMRLFSPFM